MKVFVGNAYSRVEGTPEQTAALRELLSYKVEGAEFAIARSPHWDGSVKLMTPKGEFPTGLLSSVIEFLGGSGDKYELVDLRKPPALKMAITTMPPFPPRDYQLEAVGLSDSNDRGVFAMGTGCLAGDSEIMINRGGNGRKTTIEKAYSGWHGIRCAAGKSGYDRKIPTYTRSYQGDKIKLNLVEDIVMSGVKKVYRLTLSNGLSIKATSCHKFLTEKGFIPISALSMDDKVMCDLNDKNPKNKRKKPRKDFYLQIQLKFHPFAGGATKLNHRGERIRMHRVALHRVIAEAHHNGLELEEFVLRVRADELDGLEFFDPKEWAVHHKDHNHRNNIPDNLEFLTHREHTDKHGDFDRFSLGVTSFSNVKSIEFCGEIMTYDLVCADPWRNFVANKMVVHNSGKTMTSALIVAKKQVPTLFVTPDTGLRVQATEFYEAMFPKQISNNILSDKPIIIANIQSLANKPPEAFKRFQMLMIDEFHHAAAKSYQKLNKLCLNAFYRYGFTGTYMRSDGKDMEMRGVLDQVIFKITVSDLIERGYLVRPHIIITRYAIPKKAIPYRCNYVTAYNYIIEDQGFHNLACEIARTKIAEGKQTLILVRRKEHGRVLAEMLPDAVYLSGDDDKDHREYVKSQFNKKKIRCVIATNIFGEGIDIPSIDVLINARAQKTEIQTSQGAGRVLRMHEGKESAEIFDFWIVGQKHLEAHSIERLQSYRKNRAFKISVVRSN